MARIEFNLFCMERGLKVVAGISASGKGTAVRALREKHPEIYRAATCTTRPPRPDEQINGHYRFVSQDEFAELIKNEELFEYQTVWGYQYGLPKSELEKAIKMERPVLLELDIRGVQSLLSAYPETRVVFLSCTQAEQRQRLIERGTSIETIPTRLNGSAEELKLAEQLALEYPNSFYIVDNTNQSPEATIQTVESKLFH